MTPDPTWPPDAAIHAAAYSLLKTSRIRITGEEASAAILAALPHLGLVELLREAMQHTDHRHPETWEKLRALADRIEKGGGA